MTDAAVTLTAEEWEKAMAFVLSAKEDEKESVKGRKPPTRRRPAYVAPVKALDTGDGGDKWTAVMPPTGSNTNLTEMPSTGPAGTSDTSTPPAEPWYTRIGTPQSTGTPDGSMASNEDLHTTPGGEASLPDGSFLCVKAGDVSILVDKVKAADERNPRPDTHPWWVEVKAHLARRASALGVSELIPSGW
jgi:hypothetical protein